VVAAPAQPVAAQAKPAEESPRRPLTDAKAQVDAAIQNFSQDPEATLSALQELNADFAPHPLVLQSLALHSYRAGRIEPSIAVAREAILLCFERGHSYMAAELFREMRQHRSHLALTLEQLLTIGHTLVKMEDYATAAKAYTAVIGQDHGESRAVKGLLQVAEKILHEKHKPDASAKVYRYLLQHCSASPLVEYMQTGLEEAERTMAQATAGA
jgi:tetratricopeptide (TPR) repeat protein